MIKRYLIIICFLVLKIYSQNNYHLFEQIKGLKNDSLKVDSLNKLCWSNSTKDVYLSEEIAKEVLKIGKDINYKKGTAKAYILLGNIYIQKKDFQKAIEYYQQGLQIRESINDKSGVAAVYGNIGNAFFLLQQLDKALEYQENALDIFNSLEKLKHSGEYWFDIAECDISIGKIYVAQAKYKQAEKMFKDALLLNEKIFFLPALLTNYNELAIFYYKTNNITLSETYFNKILNLISKIDDKKVISDIYLNYSLAIFQKETLKGLTFCDKGIDLANTIQDRENILRGLQLKSDILIKLEQYKQALDAYFKYTQLKDSIFNESTSRYFNDIQAKYEFTQKNNHIKLLEKEKVIKQSKIKQQQIFIIGIIIILVLIAFLLAYIYKSYKTTQSKNLIIAQKNKDILESIDYAKRIQQAILPNEKYWEKLLPNSFVYYAPKDIVAGDFYWIEENDHYIFIAAADCTGHGVPGAMISVICSTALTKAVIEDKLIDTNDILNRTREIVLEKLSKSEENIQDGMDICLIRMKKNSNKYIQYSGANRPLFLITSNYEIKEIKPDKQPIGKYDDAQPFSKHDIILDEHTMIYAITDGYADQFGGNKNKKFSLALLRATLKEHASLELNKQKLAFETTLANWKKHNEQTDDITLIGIKII